MLDDSELIVMQWKHGDLQYKVCWLVTFQAEGTWERRIILMDMDERTEASVPLIIAW